MIKTISLENTFGIRKLDTDFSIKNLTSSDYEGDFISDSKKFYSLTPTFLSKNATGKTSLLKAVGFILRFTNKDSFVREIKHYLQIVMNNFQMQERRKNISDTTPFSLKETDGGFEMGFEDHANALIKNLFKQVSYAGSHHLSIELEITNDRKLLLEMGDSYFLVRINGEIVDVNNILSTFNYKKVKNLSWKQIEKEIDEHIQESIGSFVFVEESVSAIYRDTAPSTSLSEISQKHLAQSYITKLSKELGFEFVKSLLKKLDSNIIDLNYDPESNIMHIFLKGFEGNVSINASMLSFGTIKTLEIFAKSIDLFKKGGVMLIDEIENGLHLSLIKLIVSIYQDEEINTSRAQLILTTHNPLLAEREIIDARNVYLYEHQSLVNIKNLSGFSRTEDMHAFIKAKNYYNDIFWISKDSDPKSTLSNIAINQIINLMTEGVTWRNH